MGIDIVGTGHCRVIGMPQQNVVKGRQLVCFDLIFEVGVIGKGKHPILGNGGSGILVWTALHIIKLSSACMNNTF